MGGEKTREKSKAKHPSYFQNLSFYATEYCENASIHGLKFLGERRRGVIEKLWWLIFFGLSLFFCVRLIGNTYQKWMNAPVLISLASHETVIWDIPFPAVTICPNTKAAKNKFNIGEVLKNIEGNSKYSEEELNQLEYISLLCSRLLKIAVNISRADTTDGEAIKFLIKTSPDLDNIIYSCVWSTKKCHAVDFTPILTSGGVCYTFNMLDRDELFTKEAVLDYYQNLSINHQPASQWSMEEGFAKEAQLNAFPRRMLLPGTIGGFELILNTSTQDTDYNCKDASEGYKVILHHPAVIPRFDARYFWVPLDQIVSVDVDPNLITTAPELKSYHPLDRNCYYVTEKSLRFFQNYDQQNCLLECLTNFTYTHCGCVGFFMPRDNSTPICASTKTECLYEANVEFIAREAMLQMDKKNKTTGKRNVECKCLPSCYALDYNFQTSQINWDWRQGNIASDDNKTFHLSKLRIFFKDMQFTSFQRNELYGGTQLLANCGGLLGLFTGFSFLSLVEILYFATLRFVCNVRKYGWHYWSGAEELLEINVHI